MENQPLIELTREQRLQFCKICKNQKLDFNQGLVCGLTGRLADFNDSCIHFEEDTELTQAEGEKQIQTIVQENLAGRSLRLANFLIDLVVFIIILATAGFVLQGLGLFLGITSSPNLSEMSTAGKYLLRFVTGMFYFTLFEALTGRTPAKYITGTRVVRTDGSKAELSTIVKRSLLRYIPFEAFSFLGATPTGWHDRYSDTLVIRHKALPVQLEPQEHYPGVGQSIGITGFFLVLMVAFVPIIPLFGFIDMDFGVFAYYLAFSLTAVWVVNRWRFRRTGQSGFHYRLADLRFLPLLALAALALQTGVMAPLLRKIPIPEALQGLEMYSFTDTGFFSLLTIVVLAPVFEELLFRGIIQDGLMKRIGPWPAIFLSSFLFGFMHLNPWQFVTGVVMGIFIGWVYYMTRDILMAIALHLFNNLFAILTHKISVILADDGKVPTLAAGIFSGTSYYLVVGVAILVTLGCIALLHYFLANRHQQVPEVMAEEDSAVEPQVSE